MGSRLLGCSPPRKHQQRRDEHQVAHDSYAKSSCLFLLQCLQRVDSVLIFDASNADGDTWGYIDLNSCACSVIDLTPRAGGQFCVPAWNLSSSVKAKNVSMVSCGAQASIPTTEEVDAQFRDVYDRGPSSR